GRIYRVVPHGEAPPRRTQVATLSIADWVARLGHSNAWWRETAQQRLVERGDRAAIPPIREFLKRASSYGRVHALWTLQGLQALEPATVLRAVSDPDPKVRAAALRLSEPLLSGPARTQLISALLGRTRDASPEVRLQAVLTLGEARDPSVD